MVEKGATVSGIENEEPGIIAIGRRTITKASPPCPAFPLPISFVFNQLPQLEFLFFQKNRVRRAELTNFSDSELGDGNPFLFSPPVFF